MNTHDTKPFAKVIDGTLFASHPVGEAIVHAIKAAIAKEVAEELDQLVDKLSDFLEMRIAAEMEDMKKPFQIVGLTSGTYESKVKFGLDAAGRAYAIGENGPELILPLKN